MNTNTASSPHSKNENNTQNPSKDDQTNLPDPKYINGKIEDRSKSAIKEIKSKSAEVKENVKSYVQEHPFKCLAYVAISTFIFSKFI